MTRAVGIDLGTTNCTVAVVEGGLPRVLADDQGQVLFPSVVSVGDSGRIWTGREAVALGAAQPGRTIHASKRLIGRSSQDPVVQRAQDLQLPGAHQMIRGAVGPLLGLLLVCGCFSPGEKADGGQTTLKAATDVFWALNDRGYAISKEKPNPSVHGCKPAEFLAAAAGATFRISVFECESEEKARKIVEHPHTRHVDSLLRNKQEGGILRRGALEIIVRYLSGDKEQVPKLMRLLEGL